MMQRQLVLIIAKHGLLSIICAANLMWVAYWFISSEPKNASKYLDQLQDQMQSRFFSTDGYYGSVLIYQTAPFIVVALLSLAVIELRKKTKSADIAATKDTSSERLTRPNITTYPLVIKSPLGVLTAAEVLFILAILSLAIYSFGRMSYLDFLDLEERFKEEPQKFKASLLLKKLAKASYNMGRAAMIPFSLLWIPVSRGSPFLRLIKMPFEHAVKYHIWLAMLMLSMLTFHGVGYMIYYAGSNRTYKITEWSVQRESCAVVAGVVALIAGLLMWATSLSIFRRRWYELFFGVHHLYIVFFLFWLYHVMWTVHFFIIPCLLFVIDRFLRMVQSRQPVDVLSAKVLESGAIQLRLASNITTQGFVYHALSTLYLRFPSLLRLMKLQWHLFSVTSSSLDEKQEISIVIKPCGKWTTSLQDQLFKSAHVDKTTTGCPFSFKAGVEGPYGDESDFFLRYKTLVLVGGGIGIAPLLALLGDVLHRQRLGQRHLPTSIQLYQCVRKLEELCVLNSVDPNKISPDYEKRGLHIRVFSYVTSSSASLVGYNTNVTEYSSTPHQMQRDIAPFGGFYTWNFPTAGFGSHEVLSRPTPQGVSSISSKGKPTWVASTTIASMVGFYVLWGLSNVFIIKNYNDDFPNYNRAHLVVASMVLGTTVFGGLIVLLWWFHSNNEKAPPYKSDSGKIGAANSSPSYQQPELQNVISEDDQEKASSHVGSRWNGSLQLGSRPHWSDIFNGLEKEYQGQNIGVLVSGSQSMQEDIAKECQRHTNFFDTRASSNIFHYHTISFEL